MYNNLNNWINENGIKYLPKGEKIELVKITIDGINKKELERKRKQLQNSEKMQKQTSYNNNELIFEISQLAKEYDLSKADATYLLDKIELIFYKTVGKIRWKIGQMFNQSSNKQLLTDTSPTTINHDNWRENIASYREKYTEHKGTDVKEDTRITGHQGIEVKEEKT